MILLEAKGLTRQFAGLNAVNDVNFALPEGQVRAVIGPNGAGKTTFVNMLCGRIEASKGYVYFRNQDITHLPVHKRMALGMAYSFQITSIFAKLSVYENLSVAARRVHGHRTAAQRYAIDAALSRIALQDYASKLAGNISYGHQRQLEIAMGIVQSPQLFILDEPTQGLAEAEVESFKAIIKELSADTTILLIEHNMDVVMHSADIITVLNMGQTLAEGTPTEIRNNTAVQAAYLGKG